MKVFGIILLVAGLLVTIFTGLNFTTQEKVVDIGELEISAEKEHEVNWSPFLGIALIVAGGAVYFIGKKQKRL